MLFSRPLLQLLLPGLMLLPLAGCSTSSMRNLFSWNRRSEYHTLEELEKQSGRKNAEPSKTASWNPLKRTASTTAVAHGTPPAQSAEKQIASSAGTASSGVDMASAKDPFLRDEAIADASKPRLIQRTSAVISSDDDPAEPQSTNAAGPAEVAEVLIAPGRNRTAAKKATNDNTAAAKASSEKPVPTTFEAQKLAELDALLEGRELAGARRAGKEASVKAGQAEEALKRAKAAATTRARKATDMAERTAEISRKVVEESFQAEVDAQDDRAEPLIQNRPELSASALHSGEPADDHEEPTPDGANPERVEDTELTAVAAAEALFGSQDTTPQTPASTHTEEPRKLRWKSAAADRRNSAAAPAAPPFRLAGMQREATADHPEDGSSEQVAESQPTPDFDAQPNSDAVQHAPTSGTPVRDGFRSTGAIVAASTPEQSPRQVQERPAVEMSEPGEETKIAESADSPTTVAEVGRAGLLPGLSGRTWCLAAAGGIILALLFFPTRRRVLPRQTVAGHA